MIVSGGTVSINKSWASKDGGSGAGEGFAFLVLSSRRTRDPVKKWHTERHGLCSLRRRVLRVQGLRGLQAHAALAVTWQVMLLKLANVYLGFPLVHLLARADLAKALYLTEVSVL